MSFIQVSRKPWDDDDDDIEIISDSSEVEVSSRPVYQRKSPKKLTAKSSEEEIFDDSENTTCLDVVTAEFLSQLEEFNPKLILKDIYKFNETTFELPPKPQPKSQEIDTSDIILLSPEKEQQAPLEEESDTVRRLFHS